MKNIKRSCTNDEQNKIVDQIKYLSLYTLNFHIYLCSLIF